MMPIPAKGRVGLAELIKALLWSPRMAGASTKPHQRASRQGQPYTRVMARTLPRVVPTPEGPHILLDHVSQVFGYTYEQKFQDDEWHFVWEEHDLGQQPDLKSGHRVAAEWRESLVGEYPIL